MRGKPLASANLARDLDIIEFRPFVTLEIIVSVIVFSFFFSAPTHCGLNRVFFCLIFSGREYW